MKVTYVVTRAEHGGAQTHLLNLLEGFSGVYNLSLLVGEEGFLTERARALGVAVRILPDLVQPIQPVRDVKAIFRAVTAIRELNPDLIHCHSSKAGLVGRTAATLTGVPAVFTAHGWEFADGLAWQRRALVIPSEWVCARLGHNIITVSEADRKLAVRYSVAQAAQLTTVHNGVGDNQVRAATPLNEPPKIIVVARFAPPKDHTLLLRALATLDANAYKLLLVGDGPARGDVEREAATLGLQPNTNFLGTRNDVPELLAAADIFVLPSNKEGFPISILEAMRAGLPVVASNVGGIHEAVADGETGFLIPRSSVAELANKLAALISNPTLRAQMGAAGRAKFENEFTLKRMLRKTREVYERSLATRATTNRMA